jgi:hypothetical protein
VFFLPPSGVPKLLARRAFSPPHSVRASPVSPQAPPRSSPERGHFGRPQDPRRRPRAIVDPIVDPNSDPWTRAYRIDAKPNRTGIFASGDDAKDGSSRISRPPRFDRSGSSARDQEGSGTGDSPEFRAPWMKGLR